MKNIQYQQKAVSELVEKTIGLLSLSGNRHTLVFKAPTGSGKTVMEPPYTRIQGTDRQRKDRYGIGDAHAAER